MVIDIIPPVVIVGIQPVRSASAGKQFRVTIVTFAAFVAFHFSCMTTMRVLSITDDLRLRIELYDIRHCCRSPN